MDSMIKIISCNLIDLISGGDACTCYGYNQKSLPNPGLKENIALPLGVKQTSCDFLDLESQCYILVCNKPLPFEFWSVKCSFNSGRQQGTPLMSCGGGFLKRYAIITPSRDGII